MTGLTSLVKRNTKLYFKDKGMFFSSLITPIILLVLYSTFLKKVYDDSFRSALISAGASASDAVINGCVGGQLISSLVRFGTLGLGYYLSTLISTMIITAAALFACLLYLGAAGWYLSLSDVLLMVLDVFLLTMFGTALSSCINFFLSTDGQASAVGTIVSAGYGFICGAYMPISNFGTGLQKVLSFLPGTYGTSLLRNHAMRGVFAEMADSGFPPEAVDAIKQSVDCSVDFFGKSVGIGGMYIILCASVALLIGIYILINVIAGKKFR